MNRFSIYKKSSKFYWSNNRIIYPIFFICIIIVLITNSGKIIQHSLLNTILLAIAFSSIGCGLVLKLINIPKTKPLKGKLEGFITFEKDAILINSKEITLDEIKAISITNEDYYGKFTYTYRSDLNSPLSNGVDNNVFLELNSGETVKCNYQLYYSYDFQNLRGILIHYYAKDKFSFENLTRVLGIKTKKEKDDFKNHLEKHYL